MSNIIGVAGQKNYGKSLACKIIHTYLTNNDKNWQRAALAHKVKEIFCDTFNVSREFVEEWKNSPTPPPGFKKTIRQGLVLIGEGFRTVKDDVWCDYLFDKIENFNSIIEDIRHFNEMEKIKDRKGTVLMLYRPEYATDDPNESELMVVMDWLYQTGKEGSVQNIVDYVKKEIPLLFETMPEEVRLVDWFIINDGNLDNFKAKLEDFIKAVVD